MHFFKNQKITQKDRSSSPLSSSLGLIIQLLETFHLYLGVSQSFRELSNVWKDD